MVKSLPSLLAFATTIALTGLACADEKKPEDRKLTEEERETEAIVASMFRFPEHLNLTEEQQKKLDKLREEYAEKVKAAHLAVKKIQTPERTKAKQEALKKAFAEGKRGQDLLKAVQDADKLTEEEQKTLAEQSKLYLELGKKRMDILTAEQKSKLLSPFPPPTTKDKTQPKPTDKAQPSM
jgi:hypothetical protein